MRCKMYSAREMEINKIRASIIFRELFLLRTQSTANWREVTFYGNITLQNEVV